MSGALLGVAAVVAALVFLCIFVWLGGLGFIAAVFEAIADALFGGDP